MSTALHVAVALTLGATASGPWIPKLEVTWLDLDNTLGAPRPKRQKKPQPKPTTDAPKARPARSGARPARSKAKRPPRKRPSPKRKRPSKPAAKAPAPQLADLAPGDAALVLTIRMDRVRGSPYEQGVRRLLQVFYDYKTLMWSPELDPIRDFDALLIATPNPYRVTRTFLAARYNMPRGRLRRALSQSARVGPHRMRWIRRGTVQRGIIPSPPRLARDPRQVLLRPHVVLLADPEHLPLLSTALDRPAPRPGDSPAAGEEASPSKRTGRSWLDSLRHMGRVGEDRQQTALQVMAVNLPRLIRLPPDIPLPQAFNVTMPARAPALVRGEVLYDTEAQARQLMRAVPRRIAAAKRSIMLRFLGVTDLLDAIRLRRDKKRVLARVKLSRDQVRSLLELFRGLIPQVRVPNMPPRTPPDAAPAADTTSGAADAAARPAPDAGPRPGSPATAVRGGDAFTATAKPDVGASTHDAGPPSP